MHARDEEVFKFVRAYADASNTERRHRFLWPDSMSWPAEVANLTPIWHVSDTYLTLRT